VRRDATGEIYAFAVALGGLCAGADPALIQEAAEAGAELGLLAALVEELEDVRRFSLRRPRLYGIFGRRLPHITLALTHKRERVSGETARLLAAARTLDPGATALLAEHLAAEGQAPVRALCADRHAEVERRAAAAGPAAAGLVALSAALYRRV